MDDNKPVLEKIHKTRRRSLCLSLIHISPWEQHYNNLDGRTILDRLASVKYFVVKKGKESDLPYGYSRLSGEAEKNGKTYLAYADEDALPLGYTYDSWISREDYDKMTVTEKQQALLQGVVLDDSSLPETETHFNDREVSYLSLIHI